MIILFWIKEFYKQATGVDIATRTKFTYYYLASMYDSM
jgi:hypothetical protein